MKDKMKKNLEKIIEDYGLQIFEDTDRLSQFLEEYNDLDTKEIFTLTFSLRNLSKKGWSAELRKENLKCEEYRNYLLDKLGFSKQDVSFVIEIIEFIAEISSAEETTNDDKYANTFFASPGNLKKIDGCLAKKPRTKWLRKKVICNTFIFLISAIALIILFLQIGNQRDPVGNEYRIAYFDVLSDAKFTGGYDRLRAAQLAVEKINAQNKGAGFRFKIVGFDTPSNPEKAYKYIKNVMKDKTLLVMLTGMDASITEKIVPLADELEVPLLVTTADTPRMMIRDEKKPHLYVFSLAKNSYERAKMTAYFVVQGLKRKKLGILYESSSLYHKEEHEFFLHWLKVFGGEANVDIAFTSDNKKSYKLLLEAIKENESDLLLLISSDEYKDLMIQTAREIGYTGAILGENYIDNLDEEAKEYYKNTWWLNEVTTLDPRTASLLRDYKNKYNDLCSPKNIKSVVMTYDGVLWLASSLYQSRGYQGESIRHELLSTSDFYLTHTNITIDPRTHEPIDKPMSLIHCDGGRGSLQKMIQYKK
ncbi:MAG: ABC transporter substrate-binding protein [Synergistaceae bacterium]